MICQNETMNLPSVNLENKTETEPDVSMRETKNVCEKKALNGITKRKKTSGIYKIINKVNGKYYVGSSNDIKGRWCQHKGQLNNNKHSNPHLQYAWNKYGKDNFEFIIVEETPQNKLMEQNYLDIAKTEKHKCYNSSFVVDNPPILNELQNKIKGERISIALKKIWESQELRERKRQMVTLYFSNKENRKKDSEAIKLIRSDPIIGPKMSNAIRESRKDKMIYKFQNLKTKEIFEGLQLDFRNKYKVDSGNLSAVILGKRKSVSGWKLVASRI